MNGSWIPSRALIFLHLKPQYEDKKQAKKFVVLTVQYKSFTKYYERLKSVEKHLLEDPLKTCLYSGNGSMSTLKGKVRWFFFLYENFPFSNIFLSSYPTEKHGNVS